MSPTDPAYPAHLSPALRIAEQQLLAGAELCRELAAALPRPALVSACAPSERAANLDAAELPRDAPSRAQEMADRCRELAAVLVQQADAVQAAAGEDPADSQSSAPMGLQFSAPEAERARIARDVHDGPAQYFANAVFEIEYLRKLLTRNPEPVAEGLVRLRESLQQGVKEIRQCRFDFRLPAVQELGLVALLHGYLPDYECQYGVCIEAPLPDDELPLLGDQAVAIIRILQAALTNARKHANASQVRVKLRRPGDAIVLQVEDNGQSLVPGQAGPGNYGLMGMQERAQLLAGRLEVQRRPGKGARVVLHVPLQ